MIKSQHGKPYELYLCWKIMFQKVVDVENAEIDLKSQPHNHFDIEIKMN